MLFVKALLYEGVLTSGHFCHTQKSITSLKVMIPQQFLWFVIYYVYMSVSIWHTLRAYLFYVCVGTFQILNFICLIVCRLFSHVGAGNCTFLFAYGCHGDYFFKNCTRSGYFNLIKDFLFTVFSLVHKNCKEMFISLCFTSKNMSARGITFSETANILCP